MSRQRGKVVRALISKMFLLCRFGKQSPHLSIDVFGIAECISLFGHPYGPDRSSPIAYILKQVPMDREIMFVAQRTWRQLMGRPLGRHVGFECFKSSLIANVETIDENGCSWIAVGVLLGLIHVGRFTPCDVRPRWR